MKEKLQTLDNVLIILKELQLNGVVRLNNADTLSKCISHLIQEREKLYTKWKLDY